MSYDIEPREMARVAAETAAGRDRLRQALDQVVPLADQAMDATRPSPPIAAELDRFLAEHEKSAREMLARVESTLTNGERAVRSYVHGDAEMAAQYAEEAHVFARPPVPFTPQPPEVARYLPPRIRG